MISKRRTSIKLKRARDKTSVKKRRERGRQKKTQSLIKTSSANRMIMKRSKSASVAKSSRSRFGYNVQTKPNAGAQAGITWNARASKHFRKKSKTSISSAPSVSEMRRKRTAIHRTKSLNPIDSCSHIPIYSFYCMIDTCRSEKVKGILYLHIKGHFHKEVMEIEAELSLCFTALLHFIQ